MKNNFIRRLARNIFKTTPYLPEQERRSRVTPEVQAAMADIARAQQERLHRQAQAIGRENHNTEWKAVEGLGEKVGSIPLEAIHQLAAANGKTVEEVMNDSDFIQSILRKNPAYQVKVRRGTKGQEYGPKPGPVDMGILNPMRREPEPTMWDATVDKLIKA